MIVNKPSIFFILLFWAVLTGSAQDHYGRLPQEKEAIDSLISQALGMNDELVNGFYYPLPDPRIQGHPYFYDSWENATLFIRGNVFPEIPVKYDLVSEQVIIKIPEWQTHDPMLSINKAQVDSFYFKSATYLNSRMFFPEQEEIRFYEKVVYGELSLVKKHSRQFIGMYNGMTPRGKYSAIKTNLFLIYQNRIYPADNKTWFLRAFEKKHRKAVSQFMREKEIHFKTATSGQLELLLDACTELVFQKKQ